MKVYSPSQTSTWMRCPVLRKLQADGWRSKYLQKKDVAGAIGTAFAAGVGAWNNMRMESEQGAREVHEALAALSDQEMGGHAVGVATSVFKQQIRDFETAGFTLEQDDYYNNAETEVQKAVARYCKNDPIPKDYRIVAVEQAFPDHGNCRPDLIVRTPKSLAVVDYKTKVELKTQYKAKTIKEYDNSQQALHYTWSVEDTYGEPCSEFIIALAVFKPQFNVELYNQALHPESRQVWLQGMQQVWATMESHELGTALPWMSDKHMDNFGDCEMKDACFTYHYDPALMRHKYINTKNENS